MAKAMGRMTKCLDGAPPGDFGKTPCPIVSEWASWTELLVAMAQRVDMNCRGFVTMAKRVIWWSALVTPVPWRSTVPPAPNGTNFAAALAGLAQV